MKYFSYIFLLTFSIANTDIVLKGTVLNQKSGKPIPLVNVYDSDSEIGEITNSEGKFSIILKDQKTAKLTFSHIAFDDYNQNFVKTLNILHN